MTQSRTSPAMPSRQSGRRTAMPEKAPFIIVTTSSDGVDPVTRKKIRSHVMRGKNRKQRELRDAASLGSWINGPDHLHLGGDMDVESKIPRSMGHDLTHITFAVKMQPAMVELTFKWFTVIKQSIYPVEACIQPSDAQWVYYLTYDQAYLHSVLCSTQGFFDFVREAKFGVKVIYYLNRTMNTLRENLADDERATSDSTISTVLTLVMLSDVMGDTAAAKKHMQGLYQLVSIRGGIPGLRHNMDLQAKVLRADLGIAIGSGSKPLFFSEGFSWDPYLLPPSNKSLKKSLTHPGTSQHNQTPGTTGFSQAPPPTHQPPLSPPTLRNLHPTVNDPRLLNILLDLQEFSLAANLAFQTGRKIHSTIFCEILVSVQYRLLALRDENDQRRHQQQQPLPNQDTAQNKNATLPNRDQGRDTVDREIDPGVDGITLPDLLRLGMLAFTTTTFLQIKQLPMRYPDLARRMRGCVRALAAQMPFDGEQQHHQEHDREERDAPPPPQPVEMVVRLWFLFVARISVLGWPEDEEMLVTAAGSALDGLGLAEAAWDEVRAVLRGVMWIDWVHSGDGRRFWERVRAEKSRGLPRAGVLVPNGDRMMARRV